MHRLRSNGSLDDIVVDVEPAVMKEALELGAPPGAISNRLGQFGLAGDALELGLPALEELRDDRGGCRAPCRLADIGGTAADLLLDGP